MFIGYMNACTHRNQGFWCVFCVLLQVGELNFNRDAHHQPLFRAIPWYAIIIVEVRRTSVVACCPDGTGNLRTLFGMVPRKRVLPAAPD